MKKINFKINKTGIKWSLGFFIPSFFLDMGLVYMSTIPNGELIRLYLLNTLSFIGFLNILGSFLMYKYVTK